jgi:K+-sensing histidine kinase KdpD
MIVTNNESTRLARELHALKAIAKAITSPLELPELLDLVMKTIISVLEQAEVGAIMLWDQPSGLFRPEAAFGYDLGILREIGLQAGESITGKVFDKGQVHLFATPKEIVEAMANMRPANRIVMARSLGSDAIPKCAVAAPIAVGDQKLGVLVLETMNHSSEFTEHDLPFAQTLADLIALTIDRERLKVRADAVREARRAERTRSEVMATLSHELRMPLATIKGYATALLLDEVTWSETKRKDFLGLIEEACNDMEGMIQDILDSSMIEVDQLEVERSPVRLSDIAREIAAEVQHRSKLHHPVVDFPTDFPVVEADPRWIKQVFRNILDNAVKYSPDGGLIVIKGETRSEDVVVSISDQGIGISPEDLIPLFEKYFRVRSAATLHVPGTGLGLPIARALIQAHGGHIWVESRVGEGTTIFFSLPRKDRDVACMTNSAY